MGEFVLRKALTLARVAIVTLSMAPWVPFSASRYLPGIDIEELLAELDIPVYYSRKAYDAIVNQLKDQVQRWTVELQPSKSSAVGLMLRRKDNGTCEVLEVGSDGLVAAW